MRTIQTHLVDSNISRTVGRQRAGHVMNYVNLDKHGLDLILSSETAPQKSPKLFRIITTGIVFCLQETPTYFSLKSHSPSAKRKCTCCEGGLVSRVKPQSKIQTRRSQKHVGSTSTSNISKHKFYFWKEKTIPEIHPEVFGIFKQLIWITRVITVPCPGCGSFMDWASLDCASQKHVLGGFFDGMMQNSISGEELRSS